LVKTYERIGLTVRSESVLHYRWCNCCPFDSKINRPSISGMESPDYWENLLSSLHRHIHLSVGFGQASCGKPNMPVIFPNKHHASISWAIEKLHCRIRHESWNARDDRNYAMSLREKKMAIFWRRSPPLSVLNRRFVRHQSVRRRNSFSIRLTYVQNRESSNISPIECENLSSDHLINVTPWSWERSVRQELRGLSWSSHFIESDFSYRREAYNSDPSPHSDLLFFGPACILCTLPSSMNNHWYLWFLASPHLRKRNDGENINFQVLHFLPRWLGINSPSTSQYTSVLSVCEQRLEGFVNPKPLIPEAA
jgi:hypothetical protein